MCINIIFESVAEGHAIGACFGGELAFFVAIEAHGIEVALQG